MNDALDLWCVHPALRKQAIDAFVTGDSVGFASYAPSGNALELVADNLRLLKSRGIYEAALLAAFVRCRVNNRELSEGVLKQMFRLADRTLLRSAGSQLPPEDSFTLYRGIAGCGRARRPNGLSWTSSLPVASWYALRWQLPNPTVIKTTVEAPEVLAFVTDRSEHEFIIEPRSYERLKIGPQQMEQLKQKYVTQMESQRKLRKLSIRETVRSWSTNTHQPYRGERGSSAEAIANGNG